MKRFIFLAFRISLSWGLGLPLSILVLWVIIPPSPPIAKTIDAVEYLAEQIKLFHLQTHRYPKRYEEIIEIFYEKDERPSVGQFEKKYDGAYLLLPMTDPWGREYYYRVPGIHHKNAFDLFSLGQDGQPETIDDINNWEEHFPRLEQAYEPSSRIRKFFRDFPLLGILLFWLVVTMITEIMSKVLHKNWLSLWKQFLSISDSPVEDVMRLGSFLLSIFFILTSIELPEPVGQINRSLNSIHIRASQFRSEFGRYPRTHEEILKTFSLNASPATERSEQASEGLYFLLLPIQDPWGRNYRYLSPGLHHPESFELWSLGADGQPDTVDDIKSWDNSWMEYYKSNLLIEFLHEDPFTSLIIFWLSMAFLLKCLEWLFYRRTS